MKDITAGIIHIIAEYLGKEESEIKADDRFTDIGLDSLDIMELVMQMQEELLQDRAFPGDHDHRQARGAHRFAAVIAETE